MHRVYFYDICKLNKTEDVNRKEKDRTHFEVEYREAQKYNEYYRKHVEKMKKVLGEQSDEFRMSYELYWLLEKGMFVTEDLLRLKLGQDYSITNWDKKNDHVIAIDVAKKNDSTVVTVVEVDWFNKVLTDPDSRTYRHYKKIKNWLELSGDDYDSQYYQICEFVNNFKWSKMIVDATGTGEHMYDRLKNKYVKEGKQVIPFIFTRPDKSYGYSLLYRELISESDAEKNIPPRIIFPNSEHAQRQQKQKKFISQMSNLVKKWEGGYLVVEHSSEAGHDDYPDSLMMCVLAIEEAVSEEAEELYENVYAIDKSNNNFWRIKK
jgi:hypothetical protein